MYLENMWSELLFFLFLEFQPISKLYMIDWNIYLFWKQDERIEFQIIFKPCIIVIETYLEDLKLAV